MSIIVSPPKIPAGHIVGLSVYPIEIIDFPWLICRCSHRHLLFATLIPLAVPRQSLLSAAAIASCAPLVCLLSHLLPPTSSLLLYYHPLLSAFANPLSSADTILASALVCCHLLSAAAILPLRCHLTSLICQPLPPNHCLMSAAKAVIPLSLIRNH
jgi:hypothetical protein